MITNNKQLEGIQFLRFLAACLVIWTHIRFIVSNSEHPLIRTGFGAVGVDIFFVISGFIICFSSEKMGSDYRKFLVKRFLRIAPIYYLITIAFSLILFAEDRIVYKFSRFWNSVFFIPLFDDAGAFQNTYHPYGWTICFEMWFYLLFALVMSKSDAKKAALIVPIIILIGVIIFFFIKVQYSLPNFLFSPMALEFSFGCLLYKCKLPLNRAVILILVLSLPFLGYLVFNTEFANHNYVLANKSIALQRALIWGGFAFCLVAVVVHCDLKNIRVVPASWIFLGDSSYSIYLVQPFAKIIASHVFKGNDLPSIIFFVSFSIVGGVLCNKLVEKPLIAKVRKHRLFQRVRAE